MKTHIAAAAISIPLAYQGTSETVWHWVSKVESDVWNRIAIVTDVNDLGPLAEDEEWLVLVTAHDGYSQQWQLLLRKPWRSEPVVSYLHLRGNLASQLAELRERDPRVTSEVAASRLVVERGELTPENCARLDRLVEEFETVEVRVLPERVLVLHPVSYTVDLISAHRDDRRMVVYEDETALSTWCAAAIETVLACAQ